jgi:hypothetical protein
VKIGDPQTGVRLGIFSTLFAVSHEARIVTKEGYVECFVGSACHNYFCPEEDVLHSEQMLTLERFQLVLAAIQRNTSHLVSCYQAQKDGVRPNLVLYGCRGVPGSKKEPGAIKALR